MLYNTTHAIQFKSTHATDQSVPTPPENVTVLFIIRAKHKDKQYKHLDFHDTLQIASLTLTNPLPFDSWTHRNSMIELRKT